MQRRLNVNTFTVTRIQSQNLYTLGGGSKMYNRQLELSNRRLAALTLHFTKYIEYIIQLKKKPSRPT